MGKVYDQIMDFKRRHPGGIAWRIKEHAKVIEDYLDSDEEIKCAFCGQKNASFKEIFNTYALVLTNKRIILGRKRLVWGSFFSTITPDLYNDMQVYSGLIWGKITIDTVKETVVFTNLPKSGLDEIETSISEFMMKAKKKYKDRDEKEVK